MTHSSSVAALALALVLAVGIICALVTGFLSWLGGANKANAVLRGGAALGAVIALGIALVTALKVL